MSLTFVDNNKDWRKLQIILKQLKKVVLKVGIQADAGNNEDGIPIAEYGTYNEYGTTRKVKGKYEKGSYKKRSSAANLVRIPARSFIRSTTDENDGWKKETEKAFENIIDQSLKNNISSENIVKNSLALIGIKAKGDIVDKLKKGDPSWPPNSEATKKMKKSSKPLFDTGLLRRSIQYEIKYEFGNK